LREAGLMMVGNLHQRVGDEWTPAAGAPGAALTRERQSWARIISQERDIRQGGDVGARSEGRLDGFQAGTDLWAAPRWRAGIYVGQLDGDMDVSGFARGVQNLAVGRNDLRAQYLGGYVTWLGERGTYVDGVLQGGRLRYDIDPATAAGVSGKGDAMLASIEAGQSFAVAPGWSLEPQVQLVHQRLDLDDVAISGARVQQESDSGWLLRVGLRISGELGTGAGMLRPYARLNLYRGSNGTDVARFIGPAAATGIASETGGLRTELAVGGTWQLSPAVSMYGEVGQLWGSGGSRADTDGGVNAGVGVKVRW